MSMSKTLSYGTDILFIIFKITQGKRYSTEFLVLYYYKSTTHLYSY